MKRLLALCVFAWHALACAAQPTLFTYQGRLSDGGTAASGAYDLRFTLYGAASNGVAIGAVVDHESVAVSSGAFRVELDFGVGVFTGAPRWMEIAVRPAGSAVPHTTLTPRQPLTAAPYAVHSMSASNLMGSVNESQLPVNVPRLNASQTFTGTPTFNTLFGPPFVIGSTNTNRVAWLNADLLDGVDSAGFARSNHTHSALDITGGTLLDARLSANVPLRSAHQAFTGSNTFSGAVIATNPANVLGGNGGGITDLNAKNLNGVVPQSSLPANVARLGSNQTFSGAVVFAPGTGAPFAVDRSTLVTNLNADQLDGLSAAAFWNTAGNSGAAGSLILGTLDNSPLDLRANNARGLRIQPHASGATIIGGSAGNTAATNGAAIVIAGGAANAASNSYSAILGGFNNRAAGTYAAVGGGIGNAATNLAATVLGGSGNVAGGQYSVAAGRNARAVHDGAFVFADTSSGLAFTSSAPNQLILRATGGVGIGTNAPQSALHVAGAVEASGLKLTTAPILGGVLTSDGFGNAAWVEAGVRVQTNTTSPNVIAGYSSNTVAAGVVGGTVGGGGSGGRSNYVSGNYGTVAGGFDNRVLALGGAVGGGFDNAITGDYGAIAGGAVNSAAERAAVAGGQQNAAAGLRSAIGGGLLNRAAGQESSIAGGVSNIASGVRAAIGGGNTNVAAGSRSTIGGGERNLALASFGTVAGGFANTNNGVAATIGGGQNNAVMDLGATVPGGAGNVAGGQYSFAAGRNARALHDGSFVWADSATGSAFSSGGSHQFLIRAAGGVGIGTTAPQAALHVRYDVAGPQLLLEQPAPGDLARLRFVAAGHQRWDITTGGASNALALNSPVFGDVFTVYTNGSTGIGTPPLNPLTVIGYGTSFGGVAGTADVVATFNGPGGAAAAVNAAFFGDPALYLSRANAALWGVKSVGSQFQIRYEAGGATHMAINSGGSVGVGTTSPTDRLTVVNGLRVDATDQNTGSKVNGLRFGGDNTGEAMGSQRTSGTGQWGLDFYTGNNNRLHIANDGDVGIGTRAPSARLDVQGSVKLGVNGTTMNNVQSGTATIGAGSGFKTVTVLFPAAFSTTPKVMVTVKSGDYDDTFAVTTRAVNATSFKVNVLRVDAPGSGWAQTLLIDWMAWE